MAGLQTIPALVHARGDAEALELALIENMAREDLNPIEEARACAALVEELGLTREQVGRRVGRGRVAVSNLIRLLDLPDAVVDLLAAGTLSEGHGRALLLAEDQGDRASLAREAVQEGWSVRTAEARARQSNAGEGSGRAGTGPGNRDARGEHPDQEHASGEITEVLERALGVEVRVAPTREGGYRAELLFSTPEEAVELARRLRPRVVV
jgi:ParB family chromosome partitioning protein